MAKIKEDFTPDFLQIPKLVMYLPPADRFVFGVIYFYAQLSQKKCTVSNVTIARIAHISPESVSNSLNKLESEGLIKRFFKDNNKRTRDYMICLVKFTKIPLQDGIDTIKALDKIPSTDQQIKNIDKEQDIADAPQTIFNAKEELDKWKASSQPWLRLIGIYGKHRRVYERLTTRAQLNKLIPEFRKVAMDLTDFTGEQLRDAFEKCDNMKGREGEPIDWTLRTVRKVLIK